MPELRQARLRTQLQDLQEQFAQRLQVPLAEIRYRAEIRHVEPHNAHEINPLAARLGDPAGGVNAAAVGIQKQRSHHDRIKRRLAKLAAIAASDLAKINFVPHNVQHKASDMALSNEIRHCHRQQQRLINFPRAKCLAHAKGRNLTRPSLTSKIRYYSDRLLGGRFWPRGGVPTRIFLDAAGDDSRKRPLQLECFVRKSRIHHAVGITPSNHQMGSTLKGRQNDMMRWRYGFAIRGAPSAQDQG